jgi:hypothetical protein
MSDCNFPRNHFLALLLFASAVFAITQEQRSYDGCASEAKASLALTAALATQKFGTETPPLSLPAAPRASGFGRQVALESVSLTLVFR